jgi:hypothetical protein
MALRETNGGSFCRGGGGFGDQLRQIADADFSSIERDLTASSIIVMQNGHPTASVSGFATAI